MIILNIFFERDDGKTEYYHSILVKETETSQFYANRLDGSQCIGVDGEPPYYVCGGVSKMMKNSSVAKPAHDFIPQFLIPFNKSSFSNTKDDCI